MVVFNRLAVTNFLSIGEIELALDRPGARLVTATPDRDGAFSSNGIGKTALFEALIWCLFGRTIRKLPLDDSVIRNGALIVKVAVTMTVNDVRYQVTRSRALGKTARLEILNAKTQEMAFIGTVNELTDKIAAELLGCSYEVFCNTVYFPQGRFAFFTQANDRERKEIFDSIIGTGRFERLEVVAKAAAVQLEAKIDVLQRGRDKLSDRLNAISEEMKQIGEMKKNARGAYTAFLAVDSNQEDPMTLKADVVKPLEDRLASLQKAATTWRERRTGFEVTYEAANNAAAAANNHVNKAKTAIDAVRLKLDRYRKLIATDTCPTCFQQFVDRAGIDETLAELQQAVLDADVEYEGATQERDQLLFEVGQISEDLKKLGDDPATAFNQVRRLLTEAQVRLDETVKAEGRRQEGITRYEEKFRGYDERLAQLDEEIDAITHDQFDVDLKIEESQDQLFLRDFWVEGFGPRGIRSLLFENVMPFVTERANFYASQLTGGKILITLSPTSELKSGEVRERISVRAENEDGASIYEGQSGGERKRVDLAILLALQDLVATRSGSSVGLQIFDEVLDELDDEGVERVVELLKIRGETAPVYVISHSDAVKAHFEDRISLRKIDGVTTL